MPAIIKIPHGAGGIFPEKKGLLFYKRSTFYEVYKSFAQNVQIVDTFLVKTLYFMSIAQKTLTFFEDHCIIIVELN